MGDRKRVGSVEPETVETVLSKNGDSARVPRVMNVASENRSLASFGERRQPLTDTHLRSIFDS